MSPNIDFFCVMALEKAPAGRKVVFIDELPWMEGLGGVDPGVGIEALAREAPRGVNPNFNLAFAPDVR